MKKPVIKVEKIPLSKVPKAVLEAANGKVNPFPPLRRRGKKSRVQAQ